MFYVPSAEGGHCSILQEHFVLSLTFIIFEKNAS